MQQDLFRRLGHGQLCGQPLPANVVACGAARKHPRARPAVDCTTIERQSWECCLETYDRPGAFFFVDPPYTECKTGMYGTWGNEEVARLKARLDQLQGRWMVTLNDTPAIREIFADCQIEGTERARGITQKAGEATTKYRELVITPMVGAKAQAKVP